MRWWRDPVERRLVGCILSLRLRRASSQAVVGIVSSKPWWQSRAFDQLLHTHSVDHNTEAPTSWSTCSRGKLSRCSLAKRDALHHQKGQRKRRNEFFIRRITLNSVNFRQILPQHVRSLQSVRLSNKIFLTAASWRMLFCSSEALQQTYRQATRSYFGKHELPVRKTSRYSRLLSFVVRRKRRRPRCAPTRAWKLRHPARRAARDVHKNV